ncbi:MAG TPA: RluA family pseudouridine synthase [Clostridiaceae bacterium]
MEINEHIVDIDEKDKRLDILVTEIVKDKSRSYISHLIKDGKILVNGLIKDSSYKVRLKDSISMTIPEAKKLELESEDLPLDILYEDKDIIIINKKQGMVVHPASSKLSGTLVNALLYHCTDLSGINGVARPGIVHRIDKDTSGVLVVAKNDYAHNKLALQLKEHSMNRLYVALVEGIIKADEGTIDKPLGRDPKAKIKMAIVKDGRTAITHFRVLERFNNVTFIECKLETGRTHQIRVHLASIGHPLIGDPVYGYKKQKYNLNGQALHAKTLGFIHPTTGDYLEFEAPLPDYYIKLLKTLKNELK